MPSKLRRLVRRAGLMVRVTGAAAFQQARSSLRPILMHVPGSRNETEYLADVQERNFADPEVVAAAAAGNSIPVRLNRNNETNKFLKDLDLKHRASYGVVVLTPTGEDVGQITAQGTKDPKNLVKRFNELSDEYNQDLLAKHIQPELNNNPPNVPNVQKSLRAIVNLRIEGGDAVVAEFAARLQAAGVPKNREALKAGYEALAVLGTQASGKAQRVNDGA